MVLYHGGWSSVMVGDQLSWQRATQHDGRSSIMMIVHLWWSMIIYHDGWPPTRIDDHRTWEMVIWYHGWPSIMMDDQSSWWMTIYDDEWPESIPGSTRTPQMTPGRPGISKNLWFFTQTCLDLTGGCGGTRKYQNSLRMTTPNGFDQGYPNVCSGGCTNIWTRITGEVWKFEFPLRHLNRNS